MDAKACDGIDEEPSINITNCNGRKIKIEIPETLENKYVTTTYMKNNKTSVPNVVFLFQSLKFQAMMHISHQVVIFW